MDISLRFPNEASIITGISNFTYAWAINAGLEAKPSVELSLAITELATDIIRFAFGDAKEEFEISFRSEPKQLEIIVHELGEPFDPERHIYNIEKVKSENNFDGAGLKIIRNFTDDFLYLNKGKDGKEYRLVKKLNDAHVEQLLKQDTTETDQEEAPYTGEYHVIPIKIKDSEVVSQLIYRTYKHSYYKDLVYYPKKVALALEQESKFGVLTKTDSGEAIGYFAVIKKPDSNIGEVGEAVVLPKHRRKGLMKKMLQALVMISRQRKLLGLMGEANAAHEFSQRANARFNFKSTAILLAVMPPMPMIGFDQKSIDQHVSAVLEFVPLAPLQARTIYVPDIYKDLILGIYHQYDVTVEVGVTSPIDNLSETTDLDIRIQYDERFTEVQIKSYGKDFYSVIEQTVEDLEAQGVRTIHIDLPIEQEYTATCADHLRRTGFIFSGLLMLFHHEDDFLRMQKTTEALDFDKICAYSDIAKRIKKQIMEEML